MHPFKNKTIIKFSLIINIENRFPDLEQVQVVWTLYFSCSLILTYNTVGLSSDAGARRVASQGDKQDVDLRSEL